MTLSDAIDHAERFITDAPWVPGAYTKARCELWHLIAEKRRDWLTDLILIERENGVCFPRQLPSLMNLENMPDVRRLAA